MYLSTIAHLFVLGTGLLSVVTAQEQNTTKPDDAPSNPQVQLTSPNDFCLFLPPEPGLEVAINEDNGKPFCLNPATVPDSKPFPQGFITTAHYQQTESYTQITGFFDRTKYNLNATDEGGQYDSHAHHKPTGASCQNFPFFVSLIEPSNNRFCIRCCQNTEDCKTGISQRGCARVISPGNYDDNGQFDSIPPQESASGAGASASADPSASVQPGASASSSSPPPASQTAAPTDGQQQQQPPASSSSAPPAAGQSGAPADDTDTSTGGDDATATGGDDATTAGSDDTSTIPNTSYNSVLDDLDSSSQTGNTNSSGQDIKTVDEEAKYIQSQLENPSVDLEALKAQFAEFATSLSKTFPQAADKIQQLVTITSKYDSVEQWKHLQTVLQQKAPSGNQ